MPSVDKLSSAELAELADLKAKVKAAARRGCAVSEWYEFRRIAANPETILRLIDMIEQQREHIEKLRSALERTEHNFHLSVAGKPVRDMGENLAENATALAATEPVNDKR